MAIKGINYDKLIQQTHCVILDCQGKNPTTDQWVAARYARSPSPQDAAFVIDRLQPIFRFETFNPFMSTKIYPIEACLVCFLDTKSAHLFGQEYLVPRPRSSRFVKSTAFLVAFQLWSMKSKKEKLF